MTARNGAPTPPPALPKPRPSRKARLRTFEVYECVYGMPGPIAIGTKLWTVEATSHEQAEEFVANVVPQNAIMRELGAPESFDFLVLTKCGNGRRVA